MRQGAGVVSNLTAVVADRVQFWGALADEQARTWSASLPDGARFVAVSDVDLGAAMDALLGNVFAHTDDGVGFGVSLTDAPGRVRLAIADQGRGFGQEALERGWSSGDSTGLGLDIVRRMVEDAGGSLSIHSDGGGQVTIELPLAD